MRKLILFISVFAVFSLSGCAPMSPEQHTAWMSYWQQQQNLTYQQNMQLQQNARDINQQLQNQNSWQEKRARQEYYQNWGY